RPRVQEPLREPGRRGLLTGAIVSAVLAMVAPAWAAAPMERVSEAPRAASKAPLAERFVPVERTAETPPPLVLSDLKGRRHDLAEYRGRVVVLNFWATWCAPCLAELPSLELLQARLGQEALAVLTVNHGESLERVSDFVDTMAMD